MTDEERKQRYHARKAAGICPRCGIRKPQAGKILCRECVIEMNEANKRCLKRRGERYARYLAAKKAKEEKARNGQP